ncbi:alpha/beta-hydrolase [Tricholoma matsutake]|nr:alpha/beta-hydrolase [Tricholoma matsutake 945]
MLQSYPKPLAFTWLPITTRSLLPIYPPPEPLNRPALPSPPRQPAFDAPYKLTTHLFPAACLRTPAHVPVPMPPPENATKAERLQFRKKTVKELRDLRVTLDPQGVPQVLWNCANRYVRTDLTDRRTSIKGLTLFFAHANGFPKEIWEPTLRHLLLSSAGPVIDEVWTWESVQHGDACMINQGALSGLFDWSDNARDILNFLIHYLPSSLTASRLPTHLHRVSTEEAELRKTQGFHNRTFVAVGHSYGGCTSTLAALTHPELFSSLILIDPVIVEPTNGSKYVFTESIEQLTFAALTRRETWGSQRVYSIEVLRESPFFAAWDPEVLKIYIECGTTPSRDSSGTPVIRLKMPGIQEAIVFSETHTEREVYQRLSELDERIELRWIMPDGDTEFGPPGSRQRRVWLRPSNSSNIRIPNAGHLIPQQVPQLLAHELQNFILKRYSSPKANL